MSPRYLDGFLAAVAGGNRSSGLCPPPPPAALSSEERIKRELHPLDAWPRVLHCANTNQPPGADDQFRFRWFGLFYQGPEQDGFLLRLRLPGGRLHAFQLAGLAAITQELACGYVLCNLQGGLDLPGVPVRAAAEIVRRMEAIGLRALLTGGDCVQAVRGGEHEGGAAVWPLVCQLEQALLHDRQLADLPDSCEVFLRTADSLSIKGADSGSRPEMIVFHATPAGYQLALPHVGAVGLPLAAAQVVPACLGFLRKWSEHGERADRRSAGLAEFCAKVGGERLCAWLAASAEPAAEAFPEDRPGPEAPRALIHGVRVPDGRLLSGALARVADAAQTQGAGEIRLAAGHLYLPAAENPEVARQVLKEEIGSL